MNIKSFIKTIIQIWYAEKVWKKPPKAKVLIYDRAGSDPLLKYLDPNKVEILDSRGESVNFYVLLRSFFLRDFYIDQYIKCVNPTVIITFVDNNLDFYSLKRRHNTTLTVFVQNGVRSIYTDIFSILNRENKNLGKYQVDYMLTFGRAIGKKYSQYLRGRVFPIGSLRNNMCERHDSTGNGSVLFLSQYRPRPLSKDTPMLQEGGKTFFWDEMYAAERSVLLFLGKYCCSRNLNLQVCGSSFMHEEEYSYYKSLLNDYGWQFLPRNGLYGSYKLIDSSSHVVFVDSTLGYESLACGKKTVAFSIRGIMMGLPGLTFGWPVVFPDDGPFWTNRNDEREFERLMDYITSVSDTDWELTRKRYVSDLMEYDPGNTRFIKLMRELGVPLNRQYQNTNATQLKRL